jgi:hypothetical protein
MRCENFDDVRPLPEYPGLTRGDAAWAETWLRFTLFGIGCRNTTALSHIMPKGAQLTVLGYVTAHRSVVIYGPPGYGKTTCARMAADFIETRLGGNVYIITESHTDRRHERIVERCYDYVVVLRTQTWSSPMWLDIAEAVKRHGTKVIVATPLVRAPPPPAINALFDKHVEMSTGEPFRLDVRP